MLERSNPLPVRIGGVGRCVPGRCIDSRSLERECGLEDGWCGKKQGVAERHWVERETPAFLAAEAVKEALREAELPAQNLELLVNASTIPEQLVPDGSALILKELGLGTSGVAGFTLHTTCMSFVTALDVCACLIGVGRYDNAVIVSSEVPSSFVHPSVPETYTLLGDGAAAAVLQRTRNGETSCIHGAIHRSYGEGAEYAQIPFGAKCKPNERSVDQNDFIFRMSGRQILKIGERYAPAMLKDLLEQCGVQLSDLTLVITHQASKVALDFTSLSFSETKIVRIIERFGNCGAASIPMTLYEAVKTERMKRGDKILITGPAGAGMTMGGVLLTY